MVISRKHSEIGVGALLGVVISQALGYGLVFDVNFFFRYGSRKKSNKKFECYRWTFDGFIGFVAPSKNRVRGTSPAFRPIVNKSNVLSTRRSSPSYLLVPRIHL